MKNNLEAKNYTKNISNKKIIWNLFLKLFLNVPYKKVYSRTYICVLIT